MGRSRPSCFSKAARCSSRGLEGQHHLDGVAHQPGHHKDQDGDAEDHDGAVPESLENIPAHGFPVTYFVRISLTSILASTRPGQLSRLLTP